MVELSEILYWLKGDMQNVKTVVEEFRFSMFIIFVF